MLDSKNKIETWAAYFEQLLNRPAAQDVKLNPDPAQPLANVDDQPPSIEEITRAIANLKGNKAPGTDMLPPELFRAGVDQLSPTCSNSSA